MLENDQSQFTINPLSIDDLIILLNASALVLIWKQEQEKPLWFWMFKEVQVRNTFINEWQKHNDQKVQNKNHSGETSRSRSRWARHVEG